MSSIRWFAVGLLLSSPAVAGAADKSMPGFAGVQANGFAVTSVNVAQLWDEPLLKPLREALPKTRKPFTKEIESGSGLKIDQIERATLYWPECPDLRNGDGEPFKIVTTRKPYDRAAVIKTLKLKTAEELGDTPEDKRAAGLAGKNVYFHNLFAVIFADERTIVYSPHLGAGIDSTAAYLKVLAGTTAAIAKGPLAEAIAVAEKHTLVLAMDGAPARKVLDRIPDYPEELVPLKTLALAERGLLTFDFGAKVSATAKLTFFDADAAKKAEPDAKKLVTWALKMLQENRKRTESDAEAQAALDTLFDFAEGTLGKIEMKLDGKVLSATANIELGTAMKKLLAEFPAKLSALSDRIDVSNNAKQLALAMHNYESANGFLPVDIVDGDGKPILSWRVQLLPYLEQDNLRKQLDLTKAWDDAANKKVLEQMPSAFEVFTREAPKKGFTYFQTFTAPKLLESGNPFLVPGRKLTFPGVTDGTSNTLMIVDGETAVNWLKPGDLPYDPKKLPKIGDPKTGQFIAAMGDGSVRWFDVKKLGEKKLHALITIDGGEAIAWDK